MKKNKILSILTIASLWGSVALASFDQLRLGHSVVVVTKDTFGKVRMYVSSMPEENANIYGLVESLSTLYEGQDCYAQPIDSLHYAIKVPMPDLASDKESLPLCMNFTLQVEQGQELLRVMVVKNNFFDRDDCVEESDDLDDLLAGSKQVSLDSINVLAAKKISSSKQVLLSLSVFLVDQYNKGQEMLTASSEWIKRFFK